MIYTRRNVVKMALALPLAQLPIAKLMALPPSKPDSKFNGVQIGIIVAPYNYPEIPLAADQFLNTLVHLGISAVEMQDMRVEVYAGAPGAKSERRAPGQSAADWQQARRKAADELKQWRLSNSSAAMDKYKAIRRMYNDAGVKMYAFRINDLNAATSDEEYEYFFNAAHVLGADQVTTELPANPDISKKAGDLAGKHHLMMGYHNHLQVNYHSWDTALAQSKWNGINLDVGHFTAAINGSPIPFIKEHHDRITCLHLKDRKYRVNGGENMPWGQGDTPVKEVLQLVKTEHYRFPAGIELEYKIPEGSTPEAEIAKCLQFCKDALA